MADLDGVAVGRRARRLADGDRAGRAGHVVDDELLAELLAHALAEQAGDQVGRPAGGERHDDGDRPARIGFGPCRARRHGGHARRQRRQRGSSQHFTSFLFP